MLNPHDNPNADNITVLIFQMGNSSTDRLSNLQKVTKIINCSAKIWFQTAWSSASS